jgi:hypothetical protein
LLTHDLFIERFVKSSRSWLSRNVQQAPLGHSPSPAAEGDGDAPSRQAVGLTQEEFAARYGSPVGAWRDWEQSRTEPVLPMANLWLRHVKYKQVPQQYSFGCHCPFLLPSSSHPKLNPSTNGQRPALGGLHQGRS